jgi:hypothetical protein
LRLFDCFVRLNRAKGLATPFTTLSRWFCQVFGLRIVGKSIGETGLTVLVIEDESKLIFFGRGQADGLHRCPAVYIKPDAGILLALCISGNEYCHIVLWFVLSFFSRETS